MLATIRSYPKTMRAWSGISVLIVLTHIFLPEDLAFDFTALLITVISAIYIGFALQDGRKIIMIQEISAASFFILLAALGLWLNPYLWVLALFLHGIWDCLHHATTIQTKLPAYYPPACVMVDWSLALFLLFWLTISF